jgi:hypothetical protein
MRCRVFWVFRTGAPICMLLTSLFSQPGSAAAFDHNQASCIWMTADEAAKDRAVVAVQHNDPDTFNKLAMPVFIKSFIVCGVDKVDAGKAVDYVLFRARQEADLDAAKKNGIELISIQLAWSGLTAEQRVAFAESVSKKASPQDDEVRALLTAARKYGVSPSYDGYNALVDYWVAAAKIDDILH